MQLPGERPWIGVLQDRQRSLSFPREVKWSRGACRDSLQCNATPQAGLSRTSDKQASRFPGSQSFRKIRESLWVTISHMEKPCGSTPAFPCMDDSQNLFMKAMMELTKIPLTWNIPILLWLSEVKALGSGRVSTGSLFCLDFTPDPLAHWSRSDSSFNATAFLIHSTTSVKLSHPTPLWGGLYTID